MSARKAVLGALLALAFAGPAAAATVAAEVTMLTGRGTAVTPDGSVRDLSKGARVHSGEVVVSGVNSYLNLKFTDGALVLLRPGSRFQIEDYAYTGRSAAPAPAASRPGAATPRPAPASAASGGSRALFRLLRGGFRTVTGLIGKADASQYRVSTPVATIGIRGTDYQVILCDSACAADPVMQGTVGAGAEGGVIVGVIQGGVFVANGAGDTADLGEDQFLFTTPDGSIVNLPYEPKFLKVDPIPNPESCD